MDGVHGYLPIICLDGILLGALNANAPHEEHSFRLIARTVTTCLCGAEKRGAIAILLIKILDVTHKAFRAASSVGLNVKRNFDAKLFSSLQKQWHGSVLSRA